MKEELNNKLCSMYFMSVADKLQICVLVDVTQTQPRLGGLPHLSCKHTNSDVTHLLAQSPLTFEILKILN